MTNCFAFLYLTLFLYFVCQHTVSVKVCQCVFRFLILWAENQIQTISVCSPMSKIKKIWLDLHSMLSLRALSSGFCLSKIFFAPHTNWAPLSSACALKRIIDSVINGIDSLTIRLLPFVSINQSLELVRVKMFCLYPKQRKKIQNYFPHCIGCWLRIFH